MHKFIAPLEDVKVLPLYTPGLRLLALDNSPAQYSTST